ncbi:MAG: hypothetical protein WD802_06035 [Gemmatimonadaceae bacterium]
MRTLLHTVWLLALLAGLFCAGFFFQGVIRDQRIGDPDLSLDLSKPSSSAREFRPWRGGWYDLAVSSVNHTPPFGVPFQGKLEIALFDGSGREMLKRLLDSSMTHPRPSNMSWTQLDSVKLERTIFDPMTLSARVVAADARFAGVMTRVHLRKRQYDPGMGGMVNYIMLAPGILSLVVALGIGANMAGRGWGPGPLRLTIAVTVILGVVAIVLRSG